MEDIFLQFKFSPNAYDVDGIFKIVYNEVCSVCNEQADYKYTGPFYSVEKPKCICDKCVKNGQAAKKYNGVFQGGVQYKGDYLSFVYNDDTKRYEDFGYNDKPVIVDEMQDEELNELLFRTPGYSSWQEPLWLSHCDKFCQFIGEFTGEEIKKFQNELEGSIKDKFTEEIKRIENEITLEIEDCSASFYLFKCINCGVYLIHYDFD